MPHYSGYRLGLPHPGRWNEILNTDSELYGGSGVGNLGSVVAEAVPWHGQPYSALITVPPLGAVWLEPAGPEDRVESTVTTKSMVTAVPTVLPEPTVTASAPTMASASTKASNKELR